MAVNLTNLADELRKLLGQAGGVINQGAQTVANYVNPSKGIQVQQPQKTLRPTPQPLNTQYRNLWTDLPQINPQKIINSIVPTYNKLGQAALDASPLGLGARAIRQSPIAKGPVGQAVGGIAQNLFETPANYVAGFANATAGALNRNPQQALGGLGQAGAAALNVLPFAKIKAAAPLAGQMVRNGVLPSLGKGAVEGAKFGGAYGLLSGLDENKNKSIKDQLLGAVGSAGLNALLGGVVGGGLGAATSAVGQWLSKKPSEITVYVGNIRKSASSEEKAILTAQYLRNKLGQFAPKQYQETPEMVRFIRDNKIQSLTPAEFRALDMKINAPNESQIGLSIKKLTPEEGKAVRAIEGTKTETGLQKELGQKLQEGPRVVNRATQGLEPSLNQVLPDTAQTGTPRIGGDIVSPTESISQKGKLNLDRLNLQGDAKKVAQQVEGQVKPTVIGNKEVVQQAELANGSKNAMTDEQMKKLLANQLKNRQVVVDLGKQFNDAKAAGASEQELAKIMVKIVDQSKVARQGGTFAGRLLQAQNIIAEESATPVQKILALLDNAGVPPEKYLKDSVKVNWNDANQVVNFYRKYVPPSFGELLTEFRYTNMLSSPVTHLTNVTSNALQTSIIAPIEKTISGVVDLGKTALTGKERQYYASAGADYLGGYVKALPTAFKNALGVIKGDRAMTNLDLQHIPTGSKGLFKIYSTPLRMLEAADQFFKTLVEGGVTSQIAKGPVKMSAEQIARTAEGEASYRLFRQAFGNENQGGLLKLWDKWNSAVMNLRRMPGGKWVLPFIQTPTNILKQGVEFSPLGLSTIPGAANKTEQLSKALLGTAVFGGAYQLAKNGLLTWDAPTNPTERDIYYSSGIQPYSVKIGDKYVSYSKLGPLSYPLAMAAALANAERFNPDDGEISNIGQAMGGMLKFFGDQSYVQNIGDLVSTIQDGGGNLLKRNLTQQAANFAGQVIPYKSFLGWITRIVDPVYRKGENFADKMMRDLPGLSTNAPAYTDLQGNPSQRDFPGLNAISPFRISQEKSEAAGLYNKIQEGKVTNNRIKAVEQQIEQQKGGSQEVGDKIVFWDEKSGKIKTMSKAQQQADEIDATYTDVADQLKTSEDYTGWIDATEKYVTFLEEQSKSLTAPDEKDDQIRMNKKIRDLKEQVAKYKEYGGFKKPKKAAKIKLSLPKQSLFKIAAPSRVKTLKIGSVKKAPKTQNRRFTIKA